MNTKTNQTVLVVGGGISGMTAAIEAAEVGYDVVLIEKNPYLGGRTAQLNKYFPKMCPPTCGLEINFRRLRSNRHIRFFTMAEVENIQGQYGNFTATIRLNPRYVNEKCTACGKCGDAAETMIPNPFNFGMNKIKAAYLPHEMALPMRYVVAPEIVGTPEGQKVKDACPYGAIELDMKPKSFDLNVGSIVWATGWKPYDPTRIKNLQYGVVKNVITNMEMERLAAINGPTKGKILRPSDGKEAKRVAFIQCAGSRDVRHLPYCSRICCLGSLKQALYVREQYPDSEVTIYYIDIRVHDKLEDFYFRVKKDEKIRFIKSKVALMEEDPATGDALCIGENTVEAKMYREPYDLVVMATGMEPNVATEKIPYDAVQSDEYGFIVHDPAAETGIFGAGCSTGPLDVSGSVQNSTAAALKAIQTVVRV